MIVDPLDKFIYVADVGIVKFAFRPEVRGGIFTLAIDSSTGSLTAVTGSPFRTGENPSSIAVDPSGHFAYVTDTGSGVVLEFAVNRMNGALTPMGSPVENGLPVAIVLEPRGQFAYVADNGSSLFSAGEIRSYAVSGSTGLLKEIGAPETTKGSQWTMFHKIDSIAIDPSGNFVLAAYSSGVVAVYKIDAMKGILSKAPKSPFDVAQGSPVSVAVSRKANKLKFRRHLGLANDRDRHLLLAMAHKMAKHKGTKSGT